MKSMTAVISATRIPVHLREILVSGTSYISASLGMLSPKTNYLKTDCPIPSEREKHTLFQTKVVKIYIIFFRPKTFKRLCPFSHVEQVSAFPFVRKRLKTKTGLKSGAVWKPALWKRSVSSVDEWKHRLLQTVPKKRYRLLFPSF